MSEKPGKGKNVSTDQIQAKLGEIQTRVRTNLTSNQAMVAIAIVAAMGILSATSFWLGRRSSR